MENDMIKILNVLGLVTKGGVEKLLENLYANMNSDIIKGDIAHHGFKSGYRGDECLQGFDKYLVPSYYTFNAFAYRRWWKRFIKEHHYDIVHVHYLDSAFLYLDLFKKEGTIVVLHSHNTRRNPPNLALYISEAQAYWARFMADYAFACSQQASIDRLGKDLTFSGKTKILKNGCDTSRFYYSAESRKQIREALGISNAFVLGHIGRFNYQKNHEFLIEIFEKVRVQESSSVLLLIGEGEERHRIEKIVEEKGLTSSVRFLGLRDDIPDLLNAMDVFILPSHFEGLPLVLIEAQATGLLCFCSPEAAQKEADIKVGLLKIIPLNIGAAEWADRIIKERNYERKDQKSAIKREGFDIKEEALALQDFYLRVTDR